jgi:hypothetical protein
MRRRPDQVRRATALWLAFGAVVLAVAGCATVANVVSTEALSTGPNGPETPLTAGVPFERVSIPSHSRSLDGYLVRAPADCKNPPAILIYHGFNETISYWVQAQALLWRHCISSLVFDPSGEGDSTKPASLVNLGQDAPAAWTFARAQFPATTRLYVMGHSMGDAVMLGAEPDFNPQPAGVIVADAFSSIKDFWAAHGTSRVALAAMPDWWDNVKAVAKVHVPILVVQSDADATTPLEQGQRVYDAAKQPKQIAVLHGLKHNGLRRHTSETWWAPVFGFVGSPGISTAPLQSDNGTAAADSSANELAREAAHEQTVRDEAASLAPAASSTAAPASAPSPTPSPAPSPAPTNP